MRPGREIDTRIAREIFGYNVYAKAKTVYETAEKGDRPLRNYSRDPEFALAVAQKMKMTLIPIVGEQWFAFVGPAAYNGWESPQAVLEFLGAGQFDDCGAAVGEDLPMVICEAALKAAEKRAALSEVKPEEGLHLVETEQTPHTTH